MNYQQSTVTGTSLDLFSLGIIAIGQDLFRSLYPQHIQTGLHFGSKNLGKISIVFENLSRHSVFFLHRSEAQNVYPHPTPHQALK